jgi:hypothetical protein
MIDRVLGRLDRFIIACIELYDIEPLITLMIWCGRALLLVFGVIIAMLLIPVRVYNAVTRHIPPSERLHRRGAGRCPF